MPVPASIFSVLPFCIWDHLGVSCLSMLLSAVSYWLPSCPGPFLCFEEVCHWRASQQASWPEPLCPLWWILEQAKIFSPEVHGCDSSIYLFHFLQNLNSMIKQTLLPRLPSPFAPFLSSSLFVSNKSSRAHSLFQSLITGILWILACKDFSMCHMNSGVSQP